MHLVNLKDSTQQVSFKEAVKTGLGRHQGLFFVESIEPLADLNSVLALPLAERSKVVLGHLIGDEFSSEKLGELIDNAFTFPAPVVQISEHINTLELFHGPTLAFKDFGGRFMAQCLTDISQGAPVTILTATSGDTGAAVAHAFHGIDNINVVILFPKGKISPLQEKLFTTLGGNIHTVAVDGDFDACQAIVKDAFEDEQMRNELHLNSANSINISRLAAQVCYYFEAFAQLDEAARKELVIAVPSGNFGNLTAGLIAKAMGLPIKRFIAATNLNDTVPRYLEEGEWSPKDTIATLSNAMDVSRPNNWPRIEAMFEKGIIDKNILTGMAIDEDCTQMAMKQLQALGYTSEPHASLAYRSLCKSLQDGETGLFLGTAHPAKFRESVENILGEPLALPQPLADVAGKNSYAVEKPADYAIIKQHMFDLLKK